MPLRKGFSQLPALPGVLIIEGVVVVVVLGSGDELLEGFLAVSGKGKIFDESCLSKMMILLIVPTNLMKRLTLMVMAFMRSG